MLHTKRLLKGKEPQPDQPLAAAPVLTILSEIKELFNKHPDFNEEKIAFNNKIDAILSSVNEESARVNLLNAATIANGGLLELHQFIKEQTDSLFFFQKGSRRPFEAYLLNKMTQLTQLIKQEVSNDHRNLPEAGPSQPPQDFQGELEGQQEKVESLTASLSAAVAEKQKIEQQTQVVEETLKAEKAKVATLEKSLEEEKELAALQIKTQKQQMQLESLKLQRQIEKEKLEFQQEKSRMETDLAKIQQEKLTAENERLQAELKKKEIEMEKRDVEAAAERYEQECNRLKENNQQLVQLARIGTDVQSFFETAEQGTLVQFGSTTVGIRSWQEFKSFWPKAVAMHKNVCEERDKLTDELKAKEKELEASQKEIESLRAALKIGQVLSAPGVFQDADGLAAKTKPIPTELIPSPKIYVQQEADRRYSSDSVKALLAYFLDPVTYLFFQEMMLKRQALASQKDNSPSVSCAGGYSSDKSSKLEMAAAQHNLRAILFGCLLYNAPIADIVNRAKQGYTAPWEYLNLVKVREGSLVALTSIEDLFSGYDIVDTCLQKAIQQLKSYDIACQDYEIVKRFLDERARELPQQRIGNVKICESQAYNMPYKQRFTWHKLETIQKLLNRDNRHFIVEKHQDELLCKKFFEALDDRKTKFEVNWERAPDLDIDSESKWICTWQEIQHERSTHSSESSLLTL